MMSPEELFWDLVELLHADPAVTRSTMMGLPCVRLDGRFFASLDQRTGALLVKLDADRVGELIAAGHGEPFAPAGRVFREWVAIPRPDRRRWRTLLAEARNHAAAGNHAARTGTPATGPRPTPPAATKSGTPRRQPAVFAGFGVGGLDFLAGLETDNTTGFFDAHRDIYERDLLTPAKLFVTDLGQRLRRQVSAGLEAVPRVGGSIFRIANDRRFAPHAPPYKAHLDFAFWEGLGGPRTDPSLIVRIAHDHVLVGAGVYGLTGPRRDRCHAALRDKAALTALDETVETLLAAGAELGEPTRPRPPRGFDPAGPAARYAVRERLHVTRRFPVPAAVTTADLVDWCAERLRPFATVHTWLTRYTS
jgi:uncharacterized protein (TIGR02453 family)